MNDKLLGIIAGMIVILSVAGFIGISTAHTGSITDTFQTGTHESMESMHSMHSHMHNEDGMSCMSCMSMNIEEMDKDGDGFCDICGMSVEHCKSMQTI